MPLPARFSAARYERPLRTFADKLPQLQCSIFGTTFNPTQQRLGNNILRQRLKGQQLAAYYPRKSATVVDIIKEFKKRDLETWNEDEEERLELLAITKLRGKGAPKKKREKDREHRTVSSTRRVLTGRCSQKGEEEVIRSLQQLFDALRYPRERVSNSGINKCASASSFFAHPGLIPEEISAARLKITPISSSC